MSSNLDDGGDLDDFVRQFQLWRRRYLAARQPVWDEPIAVDGRLWLRYGYPQPGWTGYVIAPREDGVDLFKVITERQAEPREVPLASFAAVDDAGTYILFLVGEGLRIKCGLVPLTPSWRAAGLDPRVAAVPLERHVTRYELVDDPDRHMIVRAGGVQPEGRLLTLTYAELDALLRQGMPEAVRAGENH
ncbi:hypothetical protein [Gordonia caeni]|uniref:Uncharacterized protein n=1 Tax=Gordonia caeni TaxID=1007097 RepID=A0ABP7NU33_9ACTN